MIELTASKRTSIEVGDTVIVPYAASPGCSHNDEIGTVLYIRDGQAAIHFPQYAGELHNSLGLAGYPVRDDSSCWNVEVSHLKLLEE